MKTAAEPIIRRISLSLSLSSAASASRRLFSVSTSLELSSTAESKEEEKKKKMTKVEPLYRRLSALGGAPEGNVSKALNKWIREGRSVTSVHLIKYVKDLRKYKRYSHALEIIEMHGFYRIRKKPKRILQECVESIDLISPMRSTVEEVSTINSFTYLNAEEIAKDLVDLGWGECIIRSIQTISSHIDTDLPFLPNTTSAGKSADSVTRRRRRRWSLRIPPAEFVIVGKRPRTKRKRASVNNLMFTATAAVASSVASKSSVDEAERKDFVPPLPLLPPPPLYFIQ